MAEPAIDDCATPDEAIDALEKLGADGYLHLERLARNRSWGLRRRGWEDVLNTAIERILRGRRRWRRRVPLLAFIAETMRSVADECRDQETREDAGTVFESDLLGSDEDAPSSIFDRIASGDANPEEELSAKETLARIEGLFVGDEEALGVVMARAEGYGPAETQELLGLTPTQYDTALKRVRRKLLRGDVQDSNR